MVFSEKAFFRPRLALPKLFLKKIFLKCLSSNIVADFIWANAVHLLDVHFLIFLYDFVCSEQELLRDEVASMKAVKDKMNQRIIELEEEAKKCRETIESYKSKSPLEDEVNSIFVFPTDEPDYYLKRTTLVRHTVWNERKVTILQKFITEVRRVIFQNSDEVQFLYTNFKPKRMWLEKIDICISSRSQSALSWLLSYMKLVENSIVE